MVPLSRDGACHRANSCSRYSAGGLFEEAGVCVGGGGESGDSRTGGRAGRAGLLRAWARGRSFADRVFVTTRGRVERGPAYCGGTFSEEPTFSSF